MNANEPTRHRAVSMELAAYLDGHYVEMHIVTEAGDSIAIVCPRDSIFAVQRHIEKIGRDCPEIASWTDESAAAAIVRPAIAAAERTHATQHEWRQ